MANTTSTTLNDLFVNIIANARFTAEEASLMLGLVTQYDIQAVAGTTIQVPKYSAVTAADLTEGTDLTSTAVSTGVVNIAVGEVGAQVILTDVATYGAGDPATAMGTILGSAIATKMDKDLIALFAGLSGSLGTAGAEITVADIFKAAATLRANKVTGVINAVIHPYQAYQLKANLTNTFANPNGGESQNEAMRNAYVGQLAGITIYESANITVDGSDDAIGCVFAPEAFAIALKRGFTLAPQRDESLRAFELNATAVYGVGELDDSYGVKILSDAAL